MATVIPYIKRKLDLPQFQSGPIPDLSSLDQSAAWFDYFDRDGNGVLDKSEIARGLLKTFGYLMKKKNCRKLIHNLLDVTWSVTVGEKTTITASEFVKSDGIADTVRGTLAYVKQFGDDSSDSEVPLQAPNEDADEAQGEDNQKNGNEFAGYYHQRSLRERSTPQNKQPPKQSQALRNSKSMGKLYDYTPQQIANMDANQLASLLENANLLKRAQSFASV